LKNLTFFGCIVALTAIAPLSAPVAASADAPAMVDCKTASMSTAMHDSMGHDAMSHNAMSHNAMSHDAMSHDVMSHDSMMSHDAMKPGMSLDQQYLHAMMDHGKMSLKMAHVEAQCGKDAKTREAAAKFADQLQRMLDEYRVMLQRTP
jgi:pentapeptide MXKDX repeat protein